MVPQELRIGARQSPLSLKQVDEALSVLRPIFPDNTHFNLVKFTTPGDVDQTTSLTSPDVPDDFFTRLYQKIMDPLLAHSGWRAIFFSVITLLLVGSMAMVGLGHVKVKMLPFDNKSEFQVILDMPEGTTLEKTAQVAREIARDMERTERSGAFSAKSVSRTMAMAMQPYCCRAHRRLGLGSGHTADPRHRREEGERCHSPARRRPPGAAARRPSARTCQLA